MGKLAGHRGPRSLAFGSPLVPDHQKANEGGQQQSCRLKVGDGAQTSRFRRIPKVNVLGSERVSYRIMLFVESPDVRPYALLALHRPIVHIKRQIHVVQYGITWAHDDERHPGLGDDLLKL
jgi:hypothetical protein